MPEQNDPLVPADMQDLAGDLLDGIETSLAEQRTAIQQIQQTIEEETLFLEYDEGTKQVKSIEQVREMQFVKFMKYSYDIVAAPPHVKPMMYDPAEEYWKQLETANLASYVYWKILAPKFERFEHSYIYESNKALTMFKKACGEYADAVRQDSHPELIDVQNPNMIQFKNGVYNFDTNEIVPPQPDFWQTVKMDYDLIPTDEKTEAEEWLEFLVGDAVTSLMELIGYCFYRDYNFASIMFFINGKGASNGKNGKSQVLNFIDLLLSNNVAALPLNSFDGKDKFALSGLYTKLANLAGDAPDIYFDSMDALKSASGGDKLTAEFKGQDKFQFRNYAKMFFATNFLPRVKDTSDAVRGRILLVPFIRDLGTPENAKLLRDKFNPHRKTRETPEELGKFAYRAIQAFRKVLDRDESLRAKAFSLTESQLSMLDGYMKDNDSIAQFFEDDDCQYEPTHNDQDRVNGKEFKQAYLEWCEENNFKAYGRYFNNEMSNKGFEYKAASLNGKVQKCFLGIKLKDFTAPQPAAKEELPF